MKTGETVFECTGHKVSTSQQRSKLAVLVHTLWFVVGALTNDREAYDSLYFCMSVLL